MPIKKNKMRKTIKMRKTNKRKPKKVIKRKKNLTRRKRRGGTLEVKDLVNLDNLKTNPGSAARAIEVINKQNKTTKKNYDAMFDPSQTKGLFSQLIKSTPTNN